jgi:replication protein (fragment)
MEKKSNNNIVKYNNDLNKLNMSDLKEKELELFYAICIELKEKGTDIITLDITEFKKQFNISNKVDKKRFAEYIKSVQSKFLSMKYILETEKRIKMGVFFNEFDADLEENIMKIQVNPNYSYILSGIVEYYTKFSFVEYQSLKSKYSKMLMPRLSQWDSIKKKEFLKDELYTILGASESYKSDISSFNKRILKPAITELKNIFYDLKVKPIKKASKNTKNEIKSYLFTWTERPKTEIVEAEEVKSIEISKKLKTVLDEAIKNEKFEILEKTSVIEYLLKHYEENIIILGIKQLLTSNITTKIKTRKYITTTLDKLKEQENIKIVVRKEKKVETKKEIEEFKEKEKIEITADEYNKLLDEELENYIQEAKDKNLQVNLEITKMSLKLKMNSKYKIKK